MEKAFGAEETQQESPWKGPGQASRTSGAHSLGGSEESARGDTFQERGGHGADKGLQPRAKEPVLIPALQLLANPSGPGTQVIPVKDSCLKVQRA